MYTFRILDMDYEQLKDDQIVIHLAGLTEKGESVYCKFLGYEPYLFLELPVTINWTPAKVEAVANHIKEKLKECPPDTIRYEIKKLCLYSVTRPFLRINFKTEDSQKHLRNLLKYTWRIPGFSTEFPPNSFKLHEQKYPTLVKFGIEKKLDMAGWVTIKHIPSKARDLDKFPDDYSYCNHSLYTRHIAKAKEPTADTLVDPTICSFDIELHSDNRKSSSPDPSNPKNVITMISMVFGKLSQPLEEWDAYVITQFVGHKELENKYKAEIIDCKGSETRLLVNFTKLLKRQQPDIITGYNINGFDWGCLLKRAEFCGVYDRFFKMGKLKFEKDKLKDMSWSSSARGKQDIMYIKLRGIFNFDLFPEIRFNHNLPTYKLAYVATNFLGNEETKEDMPYQQMFAIFDMVEVLERSLENSIDMNHKLAKKLIISKTKPEELIQIPGMTNHVAEFYKELKPCADLNSVVRVARSFMFRLLKYVIQDARIVPALIKFLNCLTALWESSIISRCPPSFIYEQGQQIKVMAQYLEKAYTRNFVVPHYEKARDEIVDEDDDGKKNYQGATVLKVKKGLYENIATLDFASLYPSIMRAYNICQTQLVPPEIKIDDSECNIAKWSEHIRCEHDPEKRKKTKADKVYCGDHYYRWRKHFGKEEKKGLLPLLLDELGAARSRVKKELAIKQTKWEAYKVRIETLTEEEKKDMDLTNRIASVLDARQLALKIAANSSYGTLGAIKGYFPCIEGAASVTYYGREAIYKTIQLIEAKYTKCEVIYGDSVSSDTPLLIMDNTQKINIVSIGDLAGDTPKWVNGWKWLGTSVTKEYCDMSHNNISILTDVGWSRIKRVIRHRCNKKMYRVVSRFGCVDVTEDHSLLDDKGWQLKPAKVIPGKTRLLFNDPFDRVLFDSGFHYETTSKTEAMRFMLDNPVLCCISYINDKYIISSTLEKENIVEQVIPLGSTQDYVYDVETECGRFHAGPGFNIVKNTDSVFVDFHEDDIKEIFRLQKEAESYVTSNFPPEMKIAADNMYSPLLLLTKKRYEYKIINIDGKVLKEGSKGSINKRRDNCDVARDIYTYTLEMTMKGESQDATLYEINNKILNMYRGLCPLQDFIIYKGLKQLVEEYKACTGHVLFAKRLEERGNIMKAGTRLEYVFIKKRGKDLKSGMRMEDWSYFLMNRQREGLQIDYGYYLEHNIMVPVTEVLNIAFPISEKQFYKPEDNFIRAMEIYLKPSWKEYIKGWSIERKARYVAKNTRNKKLRIPARVLYSRIVLDKMYKQHGLKKRAVHRPKPGTSTIYLNDRIIEQIYCYHYSWQEVIWQISDRRNIADWIIDVWRK
uniref:DNA-directed DNA polymerase n=1 Tax=viral metagenome TaxID=1070528 RepID=A0A6C0JT22_9ZZZZ